MPENFAASDKSFRKDSSQRFCGLLAIETSGAAGSVAWSDSDQPPSLIRLDPARRTTVTLAAAIADLLAAARKSNRTIEVVAVANGPGSFTGLRIGVTAAKMLAYALGCRLVAVDTLACMAAAVWRDQPHCAQVCVAINAYRQQLFVARWTRGDLEMAAQKNTLAAHSQLWSTAAWHAQVANPQVGVTLAAQRSVAQASQTLPAGQTAAIASLWPTAIDVAELGSRLASGGHFISPLELKPNYLRDSAAEEKLR